MANLPTAPSAFIDKNFKWLFWILFVGFIVLAYAQLLQNKLLTNETAPRGIISLETGRTLSNDTAILHSWINTPAPDADAGNCQVPRQGWLLDFASSNVAIDFFFILFYTGLAVVVLTRLRKRTPHAGKWSPLLILFALVAGMMDVLENFGMLYMIHRQWYAAASIPPVIPLLTSGAALLKFALLLQVLIYITWMVVRPLQGLQVASALIARRIEQVYRYRIIFLGVLVFVLPIWLLDQGQDLLVNSNAEKPGVIFFLVVVAVAALSNWYLSKLFFTNDIKKVYPFIEPVLADKAQERSEKKVSRLLGVATILLPAAAILHALQVTHIRYTLDLFPALATFTGWLAVFYVLIKYDLACKAYEKVLASYPRWQSRARILGMLLILLPAIVIPLLFLLLAGDEERQPSSLIYLFWNLIFLAFAFYIFVSIRSKAFSGWHWLDAGIGKLVLLLASLAAAVFLWINITPLVYLQWDNHFTTLPILLCGLLFYVWVFTLLLQLGKKWKINIILFVLVTGLLISLTSSNDYHHVAMKDIKTDTSVLSIEEYFRQWVQKRKGEIDSVDEYPVFLVNTYGGGIKAAAFTNMALTYLDSAYLHDTDGHHAFGHYCFSISGASGGTIGAAVQCAYRNRYLDEAACYQQDIFRAFYKHDFLTSVLIADLGRDVWASSSGSVLPIPWKDRSVLQERLWEGFAWQSLNVDLSAGFDSFWRKSNPNRLETPLLFSNTLNVDDGLKGICAPVHLPPDDFPGVIFIRKIVEKINLQKSKDDPLKEISLASGAFLSARFPYISPGAKMGPEYHFIDGGGKDNSGASTSESIFTCLARFASDSVKAGSRATDTSFARLVRRLKFYFVSISNSPLKKPDERKIVRNPFELFSPVVAIVNSGINGNARAADSALHIRYGRDTGRHAGFHTDYIAVFPSGNQPQTACETYLPVLPLGWQISQPALDRLLATFTEKESAKKENGMKRLVETVSSGFR